MSKPLTEGLMGQRSDEVIFPRMKDIDVHVELSEPYQRASRSGETPIR